MMLLRNMNGNYTETVPKPLNAVAMVMVIAGSLTTTGCRPNDTGSVESQERFENVENGTVYDRAVVDHGAARKVVLPRDAIVRRTAETGKVQLFMAKRLAFHGHPPEPMTLRGARKYMGCAVKIESDALVIATHGEWDSHKEGSADIRLVAIVSENMQLEQRAGLSGPDSAAMGRNRDFVLGHGQEGYWYASTSPAKGWTAVPDVPDPHRTAK
jgi:hypothetical protein